MAAAKGHAWFRPGAARDAGLGLALFFGTLLLFSRSVGDGFLDYDDPDYVTANAHVHAGLSWAGLRWALTSGYAANWHPITWVSHMLDGQLYGDRPAGHHATSIVLHALNALLVFAVLRRMTGASWRAAFCAALFAWHPLRVESVAWVAERKDVLSGLFALATLWAYAAYAERRRQGEPGFGAYAATLALFSAGLMCKPMLVTLPFLLLLLDGWPLGRMAPEGRSPGIGSRLRVLAGLTVEKAPLFLLSAASCAVTYHVQKAAMAVVDHLPLSARLSNAVVSIARYVGVFFWPSSLTIAYPLPERWSAAAVGAGLLVCGAGSALAIFQFKRRPWIAVGWFWFVGALVPVLGLVQVGLQAMADRYTYLPSLGLEFAVVWTLAGWAGTAGRRRVAAAGAAVVLGIAALLTWRQQAVWKDPQTLYEHALAVASDNYLAQGYLGSWLLKTGEPAAAETHFRRAIALKPDYSLIRCRLGLALEAEGRIDEAAAVYSALLRDRPGQATARYRLGRILMARGDLPGAAGQLEAALRAGAPTEAEVDLGTVQERRGLAAEAARAFRAALVRDPGSGAANFGLAAALEDLGRPDQALEYYLVTERRDSRSAAARFDAGTLLYRAGRYAEARGHFAAAAGLKPEFAAAWVGLGLTERRLGRGAEALDHLRRAQRLDPAYPGLAAEIETAWRGPARP